jgi:hypothetical protein
VSAWRRYTTSVALWATKALIQKMKMAMKIDNHYELKDITSRDSKDSSHIGEARAQAPNYCLSLSADIDQH